MVASVKKNGLDMTEGPVFRKILVFALPLILSGLLQCLYNAADVIVVGQFAGQGPLAAVGATGSLINLVVNLFISLSIGTSITVAVSIGAKNDARTSRLVHTSYALAVVCGLIVTVVGCLGARTFLQWMDTPEDILDLAAVYLRIYFAGSIFSMLYNFGAAVLSASGDSRRPLYFLTIAGLVNVALNLVFVICFGMTADGVALATIISQAVSAVLVAVALVRETGACHLSFRRIRFRKRELKDILRTGLPVGLQSVIFSISNVLIQSAVNGFSTAAVAGNTAATNLDNLVYTAMYAYNTASVTAVGQNVGAGRYDRVRRVILSSMTLVTITGLVVGYGIFLFRDSLLRIYLPRPEDAEAIQYAFLRMSVTTTTYFLCGWMDTLVGCTRGMGNTLAPMLVSVVGVVGVRLFWIYTIFPLDPTMMSLYLSYPVSWGFTAAMQLVLCLLVMRRLMRSHAAVPAAEITGEEAAAEAENVEEKI